MSQTKIRYAIQQYKQQFYNKNWSMISLANTINYNVFCTILTLTSCHFPLNSTVDSFHEAKFARISFNVIID